MIAFTPVTRADATAIIHARYAPGPLPLGHWYAASVNEDDEFGPPLGYTNLFILYGKDEQRGTVLACVPRPLGERVVRAAFVQAAITRLLRTVPVQMEMF